MTQYSTNFSEYSTGSPPSDFTEYWTTGAFNLDVISSGGLGLKRLHFNMTTASQRVSTGWDDAGSIVNSEVLCKVIWTGTDNFLIGPGVRLSGIGTENGYGLFLDDTNNQIKLRRYIAGSGSDDLATYSFTLTINTYYWVRFRAVGDNFKAKIWLKDDPEPGTWEIDYTDPSPYLTAGASGLVNFDIDGWCDYLAIGTNGDSAPSPSITTTTTTTTSSSTTSSTFSSTTTNTQSSTTTSSSTTNTQSSTTSSSTTTNTLSGTTTTLPPQLVHITYIVI